MCRNLQWKAPSILTTANDPHLLPKLKTSLVMGKTGFLDQKIPAGGFVKIQDMGEASDRNKNHHDRRFDHVSGPRTKMYNHKRGMRLSEKDKAMGRPQAGADHNNLERD